MSDTNVTIIGNVASDVQYHVTRGGLLASFRLASQRRYLNRRIGRWVEEEASFYRIVCWRSLAENVRDCVKKGEPVIVQGRMKLKDWTDDDGHKRTDAEVDAWSVSYDLMRGTAQFTRTQRQVAAAGEDDPLDHIRSEQRARAGEEVIVDPATGEMFSVGELQHERSGPTELVGGQSESVSAASGSAGGRPAAADGQPESPESEQSGLAA